MIFEFYSKLKQKKRKAQPVPLDNKRIHQTLFYCDALNKIKGIDGDIVECGTGFGRSAFIIGELCNALKIKKKIYLCDTFSGFPELSEKDKEIEGIHKGYYNAAIEIVKNYFKNSKLSKKVEIIYKIGDVKETLKNIDLKIALLHLDLDIYSSYEFCLNNLLDKVEIGGVIIIDEYHSKKWHNIGDLVNTYLNNVGYKKFVSNYENFNRVYFIKLQTR